MSMVTEETTDEADEPDLTALQEALYAPIRRGRDISPFEFLPGWIAHGPVVVQWIWLGLRYGDLSLPTAANPHISTGGLCGESKREILDQVSGAARDFVAPYAMLRTGADDMARANAAMEAAGIALPVVVKPDIGCNGAGVKLARDATALADILAAFQRGVMLMLQTWVPFEGEAGIFYIRQPGAPAGHLTSLTLKQPPTLAGDGISTLRQLMQGDRRHRKLAHLYAGRLAARLDEIPQLGERVQLVFAGNHCRGSIFRNGASDLTPALATRIDEIAKSMPDFHFGRFDVRYRSLHGLREGHDFMIIEINGVGSEATHIWDPDASLWSIWRDQMMHFGAAFEIGNDMRKKGAKSCGLRAMLQAWKHQRALMKSYPLND